MNKRKFLKVSGIVGAGVLVSPIIGCGDKPSSKSPDSGADKTDVSVGNFVQSTLGYDYSALEPNIDARTMEIHFSKHHAGYVRKLNAALKEAPNFKYSDLNDLLANVQGAQTGIRNNGGGHFNHTMFWESMKPGGANAPAGKLGEAINATFGSFDSFKTEFFKSAKTRFGSGWAWLNVDADGKLFISSTANQDNPLMKRIVKEAGTPILGIDVWEHAYYLKYQNLRGDYINAFMEAVNWDVVASRFNAV